MRWGAEVQRKADGGEKMKHFTTVEWINFVNRVTSQKQQEAMQRHLGTGCKRCMDTVSLWQRVRNTAALEAGYQPPAADVRIAKAAFAAAGRATQREEKTGLVEVLFDSFLQPMLAGPRSGHPVTRQKRYQVDPSQLEITTES